MVESKQDRIDQDRATDEGMPEQPLAHKPIEVVSDSGLVILRQYVSADAEEAFKLIDRNRDHLSQFGDDTANKYKTVEDFRESILHPRNPNRLRMGIRNQQGQLVGSINLTPDTNDTRSAEIGYYLGQEFVGKGYMTEAVRALTRFGLEELKYDSVYAKTKHGNNKSESVLRRAGYSPVRNGSRTYYIIV